MTFDYILESEVDKYSYIYVPKALMLDDVFSELSLQAKITYGLMLDRLSLAGKNNWQDDEGRVYVIYPVSEIMEDLNLSKTTVLECMDELEKMGLIERVKRGRGLPNIVYVKNYRECA